MTELEKKAYAYATDRLKDHNFPVDNWETEITDAYEQGYDVGQEDMLDKAVRWLLEEMFADDVEGDPYVLSASASSIEEFISDFRKAMEEQ